MNAEKKKRIKIQRRYAYMLGRSSLVIDVTPSEYEQIIKGNLALEIVKSTPRYTVYRIRK